MSLYKRLRDKNMIINEKELTELVYNRQVQINDKRIDNPGMKLDENKKYQATIGILTKEI